MSKQAPNIEKTQASAAPKAAPTYTLSANASALAAQGGDAANTLQRSAPGFGAAWRAHGAQRPNTRAQALAAIGALKAPFTAQDARSALVSLHKKGILGSGTPRSYVVAFVKNGYLVPVVPAKA
jgi:hypothetical protein